MNCRQGDLAIIVRANNALQAVGRIVRCVAFIPHPRTGEPGWQIEPRTAGFGCIRDSALRPIRDQPGEDEMLRIAGKPKHKEAA